MNVEERAELEELRQRHEAPGRVPGAGSHGEDLLHQLKSLPEDEAVALLLHVRAGGRVDQVSPGLEPDQSRPRLLSLFSLAPELRL